MFAIPTQTLSEWTQTLSEAFAMKPDHLSSYEVTYEEDTPLFEQMNAGKIDWDEDLVCQMYDIMVDRCQNAGLLQYEVSNFARHDAEAFERFPKWACRHNVNYWRGGPYYGAGPSASSYVSGIRSKNGSNTRLYCEQLQKGGRAIESSEELSPIARAGELAAFGLRMNAGWYFDEFREITGFELRENWSEEMAKIVELGYGHADDKRFWLNAKGLRFEDWVAEQFIRMEA
jgi:oxygen-independent coproporphyrinogen-3 oxidase